MEQIDSSNFIISNQERLDLFRSCASTQVRRLFIIGASGAGKSTLWHSLRNIGHPKLALLSRFISRPARPDDNFLENRTIELDEFGRRFNNKTIHFYWRKYLPNKTELYGFEYYDAPIVIYGCNNELVINSDSLESHDYLFNNSLVLLVTCSREERVARLASRYDSHSISSSELAYRLQVSDEEIKAYAAADLIFENNIDISIMDHAAKELLKIINA